MRHLLSLFDISPVEIRRVFALAAKLKSQLQRGERKPLLAGKVLALLFEKPSLRTRVSFEAGMVQLGGGTLFLGEDVGWGKRESTADFARVLGEYVDAIVCRAKAHATVEELARHSPVPVINGLTDLSHPCQALADIFTLLEARGSLEGLKVAYVGDANNVASSLAVACAKLNVGFAIAAPAGYQFDPAFVERLAAAAPNWRLETTTDPRQAVKGAHAVYTDVWASMGQEGERAQRAEAFALYQVNAALMAHAPAGACFMHCLPARRGEEVTDEVIDSPQSVVVAQAGNRMHLQKALLAWLLREAE